jgi:hypothetical protein
MNVMERDNLMFHLIVYFLSVFMEALTVALVTVGIMSKVRMSVEDELDGL